MTKATRLNLGKNWKERLDNPDNEFPVPKQVTKDHPHISEYEASIAPAPVEVVEEVPAEVVEEPVSEPEAEAEVPAEEPPAEEPEA